jgi:chromosome segregation ATPase
VKFPIKKKYNFRVFFLHQIITNLQNQKEHLAKQLQEQIDMNKESDHKRHHAETHLFELEQRIKTLDNNYTTTEVHRENLKHDKEKFLHFLQRLASIMKIEHVSNEFDHELNPDVILTRAEQLMKLEHDSITDQKTSIYSLQRKIKQLKEQLENKDLHMDLLRKKVIALEEGRSAKTDLEREIDDHVVLSRKMKVKVETLTHQVNDLKHENTQLKAQITDVHTLKVINIIFR